MTNVSGSWTKARVVSTADAGDVSLGVTGGGLARIVFPSSSGILEYENSTTSLSTSTLNGLVRQQLALTADGELSARVASSSVQPAGGFGMRRLGEEVARTTGPSKPERPH
jgi:hypothetical protein